MLSAVSEVLQQLGFREFEIQLNHRELLTALLNSVGFGQSMHGPALVAIDKLDKIGRDGVLEEMRMRGLPPAGAERALSALTGDTPFAMDLTQDAAGAAALANVSEILRLCTATAAAGYVKLTPRLARGLSYYTGAIMEVAVPDLAGSVGGGGRYDGLIGMFSGESIPACGFSLGLERILVVMGERNMFPADLAGSPADVMITLFEGEPIEDALKLAGDLRRAGLRVDVYPEPDKLAKQFKYASARGVRFVAVVGADERANGEVTLKNMESGEQMRVKREEIASRIPHRAPRTA
jgi:histidyl-tRNA synthetase